MEKSTLSRVNIGDGISFSSVVDQRFKTNRISINFVTPLNKDTVSANAILPSILKKGHKGCDNFTEFNRLLENLYGARIESYIQKIGDLQIISLAITCIDDKFALENEQLSKKAAEILCNIALNPVLEDGVFRKQDVDVEKVSLIDAIDAEINEKRIYAVNNLIKLMCENEPYGIPKYGYKEQVELLDGAKIKCAYDKLVSTARVEIMFTGCGNPKLAEDVFKSIFNETSRNYSDISNSTIHKKNSDISKLERLAVNQSKLVLGFCNELPSNSNEISATKLMVACLGGTTSSKLFLNVREKMSLCYYCAARYDRFKGIMIIDSGVENDKIDIAKKAIIEQLDAIKTGDITDEDIKNSRLSLVNTLNSVYDYDSSIESWYMGQIISGTDTSPAKEASTFESITKNEIIEAAKRFSLDSTYILTGNEE